MGDIQELIHKNTVTAYNKGVEHERDRIIRMLQSAHSIHEAILKLMEDKKK